MFKGDKFFDRTKKRQKLLQEATIFAFLKLYTWVVKPKKFKLGKG